ncbi:Lsr2 family DNA-binding protein [Streptomyces litchfieldiae]|uniref:Histone-like nucleoid-structuring protein Lsr2 n=1 Tax=Streptomyces litchfieldiae TaxID=3075543 RepID=A0ABU2N1Q3_9ACTN|nr:histone-like nucleoid-structuring protein Lsr2 [Streptomyces sp. DSM 44938]MDT0347532.1 histone-like nucleoid-structuring protein Lsr2 [Streptomyces sp. DSM 44938]
MTTPTIPADTAVAASRTIARNARSKEDLEQLLEATGLPSDPDAVVALLPHLPEPPAEHHDEDDDQDHGQDGDEPMTATPEPAAPLTDQPVPAEPVDVAEQADSRASDSEIEALLVWGEQHDTKSIAALATRVRAGLAELADRRDSERQVADAAAAVERLKTELARAEAALREARAGKPSSTSAAPSAPSRPREELARIRAWARANGHQVADRGIIPRDICEAYDAAHAGTNGADR